MPQAPDFTLANQPGASFRSELNTMVQALASTHSGPTEPPLRFAGMIWADTSSGEVVLRKRNAANSAWINVDPTAFGLGIATAVQVTSPDSITETGFWRVTSGATGAPLSTEAFRYVHLSGVSTASATQLAFGEASGRMFVRRRSSGVWNAWVENWLGPLTQAAFDPAAIRTSAEGFASLLDTELATAAWVRAYLASNPWSYESTPQTITNGSLLTLAHGLGARPSEVRLVMRCTTAQAPYAVGDEVETTDFSTGGVQYGASITADATNLYIRTGTGAAVLINNTGGLLGITNASWRYIARAR